MKRSQFLTLTLILFCFQITSAQSDSSEQHRIKFKIGISYSSVLPGSTEQINKNVTKFNVLAYEFSVPVVYAKGKFMTLLTPAFIIPQNIVTGTGNNVASERGQNMFYTTIGFKYSF